MMVLSRFHPRGPTRRIRAPVLARWENSVVTVETAAPALSRTPSAKHYPSTLEQHAFPQLDLCSGTEFFETFVAPST